MAGFSLKCGDCGTLLKSVEEAQEHAELTKHANFVESTEAVLNLVCADCGKPCRSKTESDLHTKRTGHTEFVDKTSEAAKPISLEAPKPKDDVEMEEAGGGSSTQQEGEMVVPEVNPQLLVELEEMGFPKERSTRALHFSGNENLEAAVSWIVEHENDPDIDQMPLVPVSSKKPEAPKKALTPEEIKQKQHEVSVISLHNAVEMLMNERIRIGKELLEAKRIEEDNERKRIMALRKAEKEEEKRAREKIRQKLEEDKAERRRKLGLPPEEPAAAKPSPPPVEEKKSSLPIRPATKAEQMRECLRTLKQNNKEDEAKVKTAFNTLLTFAKNVATNPNEEKFRKIRLTNANFQDRVGKLKGGVEFLELCGFEKIEGGEFLYLPREKVDMPVLHSAGSELNSAINNPFFGVL
ncbi:hypothetical protein SASPL_116511 [Salvia splendens]|uniref:UBA domain-containing protein n=1 Tax=Salvia splendens TaxID=180675 RepID=A0A8X8ZWT4_SALSN|nr:hypothetical protein SASPL_116511 [Salvia splendens]